MPHYIRIIYVLHSTLFNRLDLKEALKALQ